MLNSVKYIDINKTIMEYKVEDWDNNNHTFILHYDELRQDYLKIKDYSNEEFLKNIPEILHTTVFICYFKEIPSYICLSDCGVVHELVHLLNEIEICHYNLDRFRDLWNTTLRL